jgi:hypothetical protein
MSASEHESVLFGQPIAAAEGLTAGQRWTAAVALGLAAVLLSVNGQRHIELGSLTTGGPVSAVPSSAVGPVPLPESTPMPSMPLLPTTGAAPTTSDTGGITYTPTSDNSGSGSGSSGSGDSGSGNGGSGDKGSCSAANGVLAPTGQTAPAQLDPACAAAPGG